MDIEVVVSVWRRLPDREDSKARLHSDTGIISLGYL